MTQIVKLKLKPAPAVAAATPVAKVATVANPKPVQTVKLKLTPPAPVVAQQTVKLKLTPTPAAAAPKPIVFGGLHVREPSASSTTGDSGSDSPDASGPVDEPEPDQVPASDSDASVDQEAPAAAPFVMTPAMWAIAGLSALAVVALAASSGGGYEMSDADY